MPRLIAWLSCPGAEPAEGPHVGVGQVGDMDVVAHRGAVGRRVVGPEDLRPPARPQRRADDERNQVRLGIVILADLAVGIGAGGVEVAEAAYRQAVISPYQRSIFSTISLDSPYGFTGACGWSS